MLLRLFTSLILIGCFVSEAAATARPPARLMEAPGAEIPIRLQSLHVSSELSGGMAETTVRMVFHNPNNRQLEGNLHFPLLAGQQITGFALDIDGKMRPAVPVDKAKGRQVFEEIERRRVDPALLEQTQGNNFQLRVYPIAAHGTRTVELRYAESLARQGTRWSYRLPLAYGDKLQDFDFTLAVHGSASIPQVSGALGPVKFMFEGGRYRTRVARTGFAPTGTLNVLFPADPQPRVYTQVHDGDTYFVAEIPVSGKPSARTLPKVIGLLWDSSGSGDGRSHEAELAELDLYFKALGNGEVRLTRLRDRAEPVQTFRITDGNWSALQAALRATRYDGATALGGWQPQADVGEYLLVSDGMQNYGNAPFPVLAAGQRLYAINSALSADAARLAALAERNGGRLAQVIPQQPGTAARGKTFQARPTCRSNRAIRKTA